MTMIMILLPSDNCTVCTQYYYNKYHLYNNNFIVRVVKEVATGQQSQADHSGNLGVLFQKCLSRPGSLITELDLVSNTQTTI